ncbi:MAG: hypothetical protein ACTHJW_05375 [Streptosporangiaceae bacterium]
MRLAALINRRRVAAVRLLLFCAVTLAVIAAAPVIVIVGEPLRRYYLRRLGRSGSGPGDGRLSYRSGVGWRRRSLGSVIIANPVLIALTAPERWAIDQVRGLSSGGLGGRGFGRFGRRGGSWPPPAGVREPRRPKPNAPAGAVALAEPRQQHRVVPILKAMPPALSEAARRTRSFVGRMVRGLRLRVSLRHHA